MPMRSLLIAAVLAACSSSSQTPASAPPAPIASEVPPATKDPGAAEDTRPLQPAPPPTTGPETQQQTAKPDGAPCAASTDCASGVCEGEGCTEELPGRCIPKARACTRDLRTYCGCDGQTFRASGSCPGRRFAARKACGT